MCAESTTPDSSSEVETHIPPAFSHGPTVILSLFSVSTEIVSGNLIFIPVFHFGLFQFNGYNFKASDLKLYFSVLDLKLTNLIFHKVAKIRLFKLQICS